MSFADGVTVVAVDGDDTLWLCQRDFDEAEVTLGELLGRDVQDLVRETETRNIATYGYGAKSWTLSAVELATSLGAGAEQVQQVLALGRDLLTREVRLLPGAAEAVAALATHHRLVLVTKGDLLHQQRKLAASGLRPHFDHVEIVSDKDEATYSELARFLGIAPEQLLMVGDSERSDVLPVLAIGGWAVHVPSANPWWHEVPEAADPHPRRRDVTTLGDVPELLQAPM